MSRLAKKRRCVRSKMPELLRGQRFMSRLAKTTTWATFGQGDYDGAARPQASEDASQHVLGVGQMLEHVAGEDRVERLIAQL